MRYFDASALVKRYMRETGSTTVRRLLLSDTPVTSRLSEVEVASALVRRAREGVFSTAERDRALAAFASDLEAILVVELTEDVTAGGHWPAPTSSAPRRRRHPAREQCLLAGAAWRDRSVRRLRPSADRRGASGRPRRATRSPVTFDRKKLTAQ